MNISKKFAEKQLRKLGYDTKDYKGITFRTIENLINTSVGNCVSSQDMIIFLQKQIEKLEGEN